MRSGLSLYALDDPIAAALDRYAKTVALQIGAHELREAYVVLDQHDERLRG